MSALTLNDTYDYTYPNDMNEYNSISEQLYKKKKDNLEVDRRVERKDKEEKKSMEMKKMFGNLEFGPVNKYHLSHLGIALKNAAGDIVSYDKKKNEIVNVDLIDFDAKGMIYAMPCAIKDVHVGDVIRHTNGNAVFVTSVDNGIHVVDVAAGEKKEILPTKSMFGFDFVTKIVTLIDFSGANASADQPFGNLLPLMLLGENSGNMKDMLPMMMLMGVMNGTGANVFGLDMSNPLMMMALMGGSEGNDFFPMMMMMGMMNQTVTVPNPAVTNITPKASIQE